MEDDDSAYLGFELLVLVLLGGLVVGYFLLGLIASLPHPFRADWFVLLASISRLCLYHHPSSPLDSSIAPRAHRYLDRRRRDLVLGIRGTYIHGL